jgi:hypothetical protein
VFEDQVLLEPDQVCSLYKRPPGASEKYHDVIADGPVDKRIFEPSLIGK